MRIFLITAFPYSPFFGDSMGSFGYSFLRSKSSTPVGAISHGSPAIERPKYTDNE
jgi:hypothetical protein